MSWMIWLPATMTKKLVNTTMSRFRSCVGKNRAHFR